MRKAIRTTIEESLLDEIKKIAKSKNINMNDVIEDVLSEFLFWQDFKLSPNKVIDNSECLLETGISKKVEKSIREIINDYGLYVDERLELFIGHISNSIADAIYMGNFYRAN